MYNIVLVDDDKFVLQQLAECIDWNRFGFNEPKIFSSGESALEHIRKAPVHAVISDIKMDKMSGLELARICKKEYPDLRFAILSAYRDFEYARQAMSYGVNEYIVKPIIYSEFTECIKRLHEAVSQKFESELSSASRPDAIMQAIKYMNDHLNENLTLNDVAKHTGYHPNYFSIYFKQKLNENFITFLTKLRVTKAKLLLRNTDLKIAVICEQVGYKNQTHFYNLFREHADGLTPLQYRNQFRSQQ